MSIAENLANLRRTMGQAAARCERAAGSVRLLAVSKTFGAEAVIEAADAGQASFGENYLQEALDKQQAVHALRPDLRLEWHFIGPIQSNKTRPIAEHFAWVHALDEKKSRAACLSNGPQACRR